MNFTKFVNAEDYGRWENDRYTIQMFSQWNGARGSFYMAYDKAKLSKRMADRPIASFEEAVALCLS